MTNTYLWLPALIASTALLLVYLITGVNAILLVSLFCVFYPPFIIIFSLVVLVKQMRQRRQ